MYNEERNPFFNVREESVYTDSGITIPKKALINDETDQLVGIVSENYELVTNQEVNNIFGEALSDLKVKEVQDHLDATTQRWRRRVIFDDDMFNSEVLPGDTVGLLLEIFNGYNARTAFGYEIMGYRYACENGLITGKKSMLRDSYAHYVDNPDRLRLSVESKVESFNEKVLTWREWTKIPFGRSKFESFIDGRSYLGNKVKESIKEQYEPVMNREELEENKYGAFNVLTYLSSHETKARKGSNIFSNRYKAINRAASDFYYYDDEETVNG
ncbi:MAG: DUF932 domain-containing protein [Sulfurimonas sp.]